MYEYKKGDRVAVRRGSYSAQGRVVYIFPGGVPPEFKAYFKYYGKEAPVRLSRASKVDRVVVEKEGKPGRYVVSPAQHVSRI